MESIKEQLLRENTEAKTIPQLMRVVIKAVKAFHEKTVTLDQVGAQARPQTIRWTPSFVAGAKPQHDTSRPYTILTLGKFLSRLESAGPRRAKKADKNLTAVMNLLESYAAGEVSRDNVLLLTKHSGRLSMKLTRDLKRRRNEI